MIVLVYTLENVSVNCMMWVITRGSCPSWPRRGSQGQTGSQQTPGTPPCPLTSSPPLLSRYFSLDLNKQPHIFS